jgi:hypothetical protein
MNEMQKTPLPIGKESKQQQQQNLESKQLYDVLFNNKESCSINDDNSPLAEKKWNNLGVLFKENYKMDLNQNYASNAINNIFENPSQNLSKSKSQKGFEKHTNVQNLPKKFFYESEIDTTEEVKNLFSKNLENENFRKEPIMGYEITDHTGSDSDSDAIETSEHRKEKEIPTWASNLKFINALILEKNKPQNVRKIFGRLKVSNLDLNYIFNTNKKSYKIRGDSADWKHDNTNSSKIYKEDLNEPVAANEDIKPIFLDMASHSPMTKSPAKRESQIYANYIEK